MDGPRGVIKTYRQGRSETEGNGFTVRLMEDIYDERGGAADDPHRHEFYLIVLTSKASGKHIIDFHEFVLSNHQAYFLSPGQVHQIIETSRSEGFVLTFTPTFLENNHIDRCFIEDINLFRDYGQSPPIELSAADFDLLREYAEQLLKFNRADHKFKDDAISSLLKLFLIHCNNLCLLDFDDNTQFVQTGTLLLRDFRDLVDRNFRQWHKVNMYADALHVSPDHLNRTVKSLIGRTAKEYLQTRIVTAAKRMLLFSGLTAKEIGYALGFNEPAHFSQFFKRNTGLSPTAFRNGS